MGTGWRRARNAALGLTVCTSIPRDELDALESASPRTPKDNNSGSPRLLAEESFSPRLENFSPTPRLQCRTSSSPRLRCQRVGNNPRFLSGSSHSSPRLQCRTSPSPKVRNIENVPLTEGSVPSSPRSPSRLSLFKSSIRLSRSTCGMCLQTMKPGQGHAIFTAECSHAFHFPCIASNVKHGNLVCPVCRAKWKEVPSQVSVKKEEKAEKSSVLTSRSSSRRNASLTSSEDYRRLDRNAEEESSSFTPRGESRQMTATSEPLYDDDEPLDPNYPRPNAASTFSTILEEEEEFEFKGFVVEPKETPAPAPRNNRPGFGNGKAVEVTIHPEVEVLAAGKSCETFAVLLQVKAPPASSRQLKNAKRNSPNLILDPNCRAPIDLVTVLDVSGSMSGTKLQLLKRAMRLVISSLSAADRLSVVAFSATAKRIFPLKRMVPQGQRAARRVIDRLVCGEGTNIPDGLKKAAKILEDRRHRNPVASIMLLSDGQDEHSLGTTLYNRPSFPSSIRQSTRYGQVEIPVHAFGFGSDHDSAKMHAISEKSGGTFSFIQAEDSVHDAFAQCIGGLLSVVVQDVQLTMSCCSTPGVEINNIYAGTCKTRLLDDYGTVKLGDLYAEEERDIVVELKIPSVRYPNPMNVLCVCWSFKDPVTQQVAYGNEQFLTIPRPESVCGYAGSASPTVEKYKIKLRTAQAISEARTFADRGDTNGAQRILHDAKFLLQRSDASRTIDGLRSALDAEISRIQSRNSGSRERQRSRRTAYSEPTTPTTPSVLDIIMRYQTDSNGEPLTPTSAWRAAEKLAKVAMMRKSLNRVSDLHGFENARF